MSFNLLIIRHAESQNNVIAESTEYSDFISTRVHEPEITERGHAQARALADHLSSSKLREFSRGRHPYPTGYGITRFVASPMLRTVQTAAPSAAALGLPLEIWHDIFEHGGLFEGNPEDAASVKSFPGLRRSEYAARFPGLVLPEQITEEGWWTGGYEALEASAERAAAVAARLKAMAAAEQNAPPAESTTLAMVTHGTFINQLLHHLLGVPESASAYFFMANTGITRIEFAGDGFCVVRYVNRTAHLPLELLSR